MRQTALYSFDNVGKFFETSTGRHAILHSLSTHIAHGETVAIVGASGVGKSTLLHLMGTLDTPSSGAIYFSGRDIGALSFEERATVRNKEIGFVFQFHHLLAEFSTLENVAMQALLGGVPRKKALQLAERALSLVGLEHKKAQSVTTLSGGERQRAAIARAILLEPKVLLADEPTGNLDAKTGAGVAELLLRLNQTLGMALVVVTHNPALATMMHRCFELKAGELYEITP